MRKYPQILSNLKNKVHEATAIQERSKRLVQKTLGMLREREEESLQKLREYFSRKANEISKYHDNFVSVNDAQELFSRFGILGEALERAKMKRRKTQSMPRDFWTRRQRIYGKYKFLPTRRVCRILS